MPQRMTIFVTAILVIVVAAVSLTARTSIAQRAADECITKPNGTAPQGSHWYYRIDRATRKQCWYLGAEGEKIRTRQAGSRMKSSAPKATPRPTTETANETTAAEVPSAKTTSAAAEAAPAPIIAAGAPAGVDDPAADFSIRWPALPKLADATERTPALTSNSYADEQPTADPQNDAPLQWPIVAPADVPATGSTLESLFKSDRMRALLAGALGLTAIFLGAVFNPSRSRRAAPHRVRKRWWRWSSKSAAGDQIDPGFGDPLAAARRVDLASPPLKTRAPRKPTVPKSGAPESSAPKSGTPKQSDAGHDLEASLQQLLSDWKRAAA
jgi:hypothetical protein